MGAVIHPQEVLNNLAWQGYFFILLTSNLRPGTREDRIAESLSGRETSYPPGLGHEEKQTPWDTRFHLLTGDADVSPTCTFLRQKGFRGQKTPWKRGCVAMGARCWAQLAQNKTCSVKAGAPAGP